MTELDNALIEFKAHLLRIKQDPEKVWKKETKQAIDDMLHNDALDLMDGEK